LCSAIDRGISPGLGRTADSAGEEDSDKPSTARRAFALSLTYLLHHSNRVGWTFWLIHHRERFDDEIAQLEARYDGALLKPSTRNTCSWPSAPPITILESADVATSVGSADIRLIRWATS
jgi:hypothetical protein